MTAAEALSADIYIICNGRIISKKEITRSMPTILRSRMHSSASAWISFCDDIDKALLPSVRSKQIEILAWLLFPVGLLIILPYKNRYYTAIGIGVFVCWLLGGIISGLINRGIRSDLDMICADMTAAAQTTGVSFSVRRRNEGNGTEDDGRKRSHTYIEVQIMNDSNSPTLSEPDHLVESESVPVTPISQATACGIIPSAPSIHIQAVPVPGDNIVHAEVEQMRSPAERLRDLEEMRDLLTEEEYRRKRADILSGV